MKYTTDKEGKVLALEVGNSDTWSLYSTLAPLLAASLEKFIENCNGFPVEFEECPENWQKVLQEMLFAFQKLSEDDWTKEFCSGEMDISIEKVPGSDYYQSVKGPNHTFSFDSEKAKKVEERIQRGLNYFGRYYQELWD